VNNREREEPDGSFFVGRVIRVYIVVFVLGAGFGLALGFYAGLIASKISDATWIQSTYCTT